MSRSAKKFFYGVFFVLLFLLIAWGVFRAAVPAPSCSDGILNQNEENIDCGGYCISCATARTEPLRAGSVQVFGTERGRTVLLGSVTNPNSAYAADEVSYAFVIKGRNGRADEVTPRKTARVRGAERIFLFESEITMQFSDIKSADIVFYGTMWRSAAEVLPTALSVSNVALAGDTGGVSVRGTVKNESPFAVNNVRIIAVLFDRSGNALFASQTAMDMVAGNSEQEFPAVRFPSGESWQGSIEASATEVYVGSL